MQPRRLLFLSETFPPRVGGIENYLKGFLATLPPKITEAIAPIGEGDIAWDAMQLYKITRTSMRGFTYPRWRRALTTLLQVSARFRPDVLVCGKALFEGRAAEILQKKMGVPYVVCTYGMEIRTWLSAAKTRRDLLRVLAHASRVIVINTPIKEMLQSAGIPEEKLVKIYPGIDDRFFTPPDTRAFRQEHGLENAFVAVTVCRLIPRKGVDALLHAVAEARKEIPSLRLLVVGDGPERNALEAQTRTLGLENVVMFCGQVSDDEMQRAVASADVFCLTPREIGDDVEGFGMVYLEAAAMGVPAIGTRTGGVAEAVLHKKTGLLVAPDDISAMSTALIRLFQNPDERKALGDAAKERAIHEFRWSKRTVLFQGMIEAVMQEHFLQKK